MKTLFITSLVTLIGCSGIKVEKQRVPASIGQCKAEKHPKLDHYRLLIKDEPYNSYWYDQKYVSQLIENFNKRGKCSKCFCFEQRQTF